MYHLGRRRGLRVAVALTIVGLFALGVVVPAGASVSDSDASGSGVSDSDARSVRLLGESMAVPKPSPARAPHTNAPLARGFWAWPEGGRAFVPTDWDPATEALNIALGAEAGVKSLVAYDLEERVEVGRVALSPPMVWSKDTPKGSPNHVAVDRAGGRLFVPYGYAAAGSARKARDTNAVCSLEYAAANMPQQCLQGVHVVDARSLEVVRRIPLPTVQVDALFLGRFFMGMSYVAPPEASSGSGSGAGGKLLIVAEEMSAARGGTAAAPRHFGGALVYLVQVDVDSGRQEWVVRLDACRGSRESGRGGEVLLRPQVMAVFAGSRGADRFVFVGCAGTGRAGVLVEVPLGADGRPAVLPVGAGDAAGAVSRGLGEREAFRPGQSDVVVLPAGQRAFPGPEGTVEIWDDPPSGRFLLKVLSTENQEVWWVFDTQRWELLGTVGIGRYGVRGLAAGIDHDRGRMYLLADANEFAGSPGGLFMVDFRRDPLPQALFFPEFAEVASSLNNSGDQSLGVVPSLGRGDWTEVFFRTASSPNDDGGNLFSDGGRFRIIQDGLAVSVDPPVSGFAGRSLDLEEIEGVTSSTLDGAARGYGVRALLVGGVDAAARVGPVDAFGNVFGHMGGTVESQTKNTVVLDGPESNSCVQGNREVVGGFVGPEGAVVVDGSGSRGGVVPLRLDELTRADLELPVSRCSGADWDALWGVGLFGRAPVSEPGVPWVVDAPPVDCVGSRDEGAEPVVASTGDAVSGAFAGRVACGGEDAEGFSYVRGVAVGPVTVAEALSSFRVYRDPVRGVVSRVESVSRGVHVPGVLRVEGVRGVAESWANGRSQPVALADRGAGYVANCDRDRTAGTCFQRHMFGVWTPGYSCGPCGDEATLIDRLNRALGANGKARFRQPDPVLAQGAENGFLAAVTKPDFERFSDLVLNNDLLQTIVPALEIIRYAPPNTVGVQNPGEAPTPPRGRQVLQFAGVEVSSSYGIACLLVYDAVSNTCGAPTEPPGSITINLTDGGGEVLAGGAFELRHDTDTDGVVGLKDALIPDGACVTADDGVGTCRFDNLQPGAYLVSQVAAPAGYGKITDPYLVELASGEARTVTFVNTSNVSTIQVTAANEAGTPVSGAVFAVYPDADSDGKVAAEAAPAAQCTTDATGSCSMQVPAGSYVLVQTAAPAGLEPIEPVAFTFASGGQTAAVGIVNYPAGALPQPEPAAAPVYADPPQPVVTETVESYEPPTTEIADEPQVSVPEVVGGTIVRVIQAPGDALRLLSRDPKQAAAWTASLLLFALAYLAIRRRQHAITLISQ